MFRNVIFPFSAMNPVGVIRVTILHALGFSGLGFAHATDALLLVCFLLDDGMFLRRGLVKYSLAPWFPSDSVQVTQSTQKFHLARIVHSMVELELIIERSHLPCHADICL